MPKPEPKPSTGTTVPAGQTTGCYYIQFGNTAKGTTWRDVKDFLRNAGIGMDHVQIFPGARCGWVRIFGEQNFDAALALFKSTPCKGMYLTATDKNRLSPVVIRDLHLPPLREGSSTDGTFTAQIPPMPPVIPPPVMQYQYPSPAPLSQTPWTTGVWQNPYAAPPPFIPPRQDPFYTQEPEYYDNEDQEPYDDQELEYSRTHPTQQHLLPPQPKTGYEGNELYANSSTFLAPDTSTLCIAQPPNTLVSIGGKSDSTITLRRDPAAGPMTPDLATEFIRFFAPAAIADERIVRIDVSSGRGKFPAKTAVVVFGNAAACAVTREGVFDKEWSGIKMVQGWEDVRDERHDPVLRKEKEERKKLLPPPREKPEGSDQRTRKEKQKDWRKEQRRMEKEAKKSGGANPGGNGGGEEGYGDVQQQQAEQAPVVVHSTAPPKKEEVLIVDGTSSRHHHYHGKGDRSGKKKHHHK